jgi:methylmalonyl-CoA mutase C-terminal domain/subunit
MTKQKTIRILLTKIGLDAHDVGLRSLAITFKNAGMEVIYLGLHQYPESIVASAIQDDVDVIGISSHCGAHVPAIKELFRLLKEHDIQHVSVVCGGIIPAPDRPVLKEFGVDGIFGPGTPVAEIVECIRNTQNE